MLQTASLFLIALLGILFAFDAITLGRRGRRVLYIEAIAFLLGGGVIAFPESTQWLASAVGIGRGVDLVVYVSVVWLVREAIMMRHARVLEGEKLTKLVRALAMEKAHALVVSGSLAPAPAPSAAASSLAQAPASDQ